MAKAKPTFKLLDHLDKEPKAKDFTAEIAEGVVITFPNPRNMSWQKAQRLASVAEEGAEVLELWLSEADYQALEEADLTMGAVEILMKEAGSYFEASLGTPGE